MTLSRQGDAAVVRPTGAVLANAAVLAEAAGIRPGDTLRTALAPDDLPGLAGPIAALLTGARLESDVLPDLRAFATARDGGRLHLIHSVRTAGTVEALAGPLASSIVVAEASPFISFPDSRIHARVEVLDLGGPGLVARSPAAVPSRSASPSGFIKVTVTRGEVRASGPASLYKDEVCTFTSGPGSHFVGFAVTCDREAADWLALFLTEMQPSS